MRQAQRLREADTKRKQDDARLRGYQSSGVRDAEGDEEHTLTRLQSFSHALPLRNASESHAERGLEHELRLSGEATGESWVKAEHGWQRRTNPVVERKALLSDSELSMQAYDALDLRFGLRRSRSGDFEVAVRCLAVLFATYCASGARSLQNSMFHDVGVAMKTFCRFPQAHDAVLLLLRQCLTALGTVRAERVQRAMSVVADDERVARVAQWLQLAESELESARVARVQAAAAARSADFEPIAWLPDELLLRVFGWLRSARDLARVTAVCTRWYDVGNDEHLYRSLLVAQLPAQGPWIEEEGREKRCPSSHLVAELDERARRVQSYKIVFMQLHSKLYTPMMGCFLCSSCDELFWAAKNVGKQCHQVGDGHLHRSTFERHQPGVALTPDALRSGLLLAWWNKNKAR